MTREGYMQFESLDALGFWKQLFDKGGFTLRKYSGKHTSKGQWKIHALTTPFVAKKFIDAVRDNQKIDIATLQQKERI
jgi:hypothetical protein